MILATKTALDWKNNQLFRHANRARIVEEVEDSLKRLQTDYIDLYQVHWPDPLVPIEETAEVMKELYDAGKIRAIGVSNFSIEQMDTFRAVAPLIRFSLLIICLKEKWKRMFFRMREITR